MVSQKNPGDLEGRKWRTTCSILYGKDSSKNMPFYLKSHIRKPTNAMKIVYNRETFNIIDLAPLRAISAYSKTFFIQVHKKIVRCLIHSHGNIDKIFQRNANNIFQIENSGNFKTDFYLRIILVK